jgi:2-hydroxychromene-2-carboxylate isomerase
MADPRLRAVITQAAFYFDLASPLAYFAAERVLHVLPGPAEWQPVLGRELSDTENFDAFRCQTDREVFLANIELRSQELGLQPLKWPTPFPFDSDLAMRAATYAKGIGRVVPFAQAAFRQAFAGGHNLERIDFVLLAGAACEMHPAALLQGTKLRSVREALLATTAQAQQLGVTELPALRIGDRVFCGPDALEQATGYAASQSEVGAS